MLEKNSKLVNLSSATPIPFVRNNFFATRSNNSNFFQASLVIKIFSLVIKLESKQQDFTSSCIFCYRVYRVFA